MKNLKVCIASSALVAALALAPAFALAEGTAPAPTSTTGATATTGVTPIPAPTPEKKSTLPATGVADVVIPASVLAVSGLGFVAVSRKVRK